jgi:Putative prokaryotic signal transducing protein
VPPVPLTRLTSVYGAFRARVMAAHLEDEGFDVVLRGALNSPYGLTVGDLARVDVYVPDDQVDEAMLVLLVTEVDEADIVLDDDRPPVRDPYVPRAWVGALLAFLVLAGPLLLVLRWY